MMMLSLSTIGASENLPMTEIQGKQYYYYEVQKNDSLYGIAKRMGWDVAIIVEANPGSENNLRKGQRIYYPVDTTTATSEVAGTQPSQQLDAVYHEVKRGETVYSIAKLYGLTPDDIYAVNPSAHYGIKAGERLVVQDSKMLTEADESTVVYYTAHEGESMLDVAQSFSTSIEDILRLNPGLSESDFGEGVTVRIQPNTDRMKEEVRSIEKREVDSFAPYCIERNDTWTSIAEAHGITIQELREANEGITELKKGRYLSIPVFETVSIEERYVPEDPREFTLEGRQELYDEVHHVTTEVEQEQSVDVGIMLTVGDNRNREAEFLRGMLVAVDEMKQNPYKINLHVYDVTAHTNAVDSVLALPEVADYDMLVTTFDKNFPQNVVDYGQQNDIDIINVFDVKSDHYTTHSNFIQLLPPTSHFNDAVFDYVMHHFVDHKFVFVGSSKSTDTDALDIMLKHALKEQGRDYVEVEAIEQLEAVEWAEDGTRYIVCPQVTKKADVDKFVAMMSTIKETLPQLDLTVLTRPNWVVYTSKYADKFALFNTLIPSRFYFDADADDARSFTEAFKNMFGEEPVKSNPIYAAIGYDVARFFIESEAYNDGDTNKGFIDYNALQTDFHLSRPSNWSGFLNRCSYLINFTPSGIVEKITLN